MTMLRAIAVLALVFLSDTARAADYPAPKEADWVAREFKFHTGEVISALKLHYLTIGDPSGIPVLVLHGNGGSAASMLTPSVRGRTVRARPSPRCREILHRHSRRTWSWQKRQTIRWP